MVVLTSYHRLFTRVMTRKNVNNLEDLFVRGRGSRGTHDSLIDRVAHNYLLKPGILEVVRNGDYRGGGFCGEVDLLLMRYNVAGWGVVDDYRLLPPSSCCLLLFEIKSVDSERNRLKAYKQLSRADGFLRSVGGFDFVNCAYVYGFRGSHSWVLEPL